MLDQMEQRLPIQVGEMNEETRQMVSARDLHGFLAVGSRFNDWIARRIEDYGFVEGDDFLVLEKSSMISGYSNLSNDNHEGLRGSKEDFLVLEKSSMISRSPDPVNENHAGLRGSKEYFLTLDMAKELAMVERNEQGRLARRYFIECERRLLAGELPAPERQPRNLMEAWEMTMARLGIFSASEIRGAMVREIGAMARSLLGKPEAWQPGQELQGRLDEQTDADVAEWLAEALAFQADARENATRLWWSFCAWLTRTRGRDAVLPTQTRFGNAMKLAFHGHKSKGKLVDYHGVALRSEYEMTDEEYQFLRKRMPHMAMKNHGLVRDRS